MGNGLFLAFVGRVSGNPTWRVSISISSRLRHLEFGWRHFFERRAFSVMSLEFDERAYWEHLPHFLSFFRTLGYYVFLKWPCTPKDYDGGFQRTAYAPLTDALLSPPLPPAVASGRDPHDVLVVDAKRIELLRTLPRLGNTDCGTNFPLPVLPCK